ncbi:hypothetical protein KC909_01430 [Candidatus Dojkabacteria bacterium]|uniref:Uncharacterized protein n=1 Tax=Candidatus Dojkabacteria bacterium TaxID=2099670 RepID=A0A955L4S6_9BACT|nr:hypothetical protein [Candidatus Dojkabacteria bacterium]
MNLSSLLSFEPVEFDNSLPLPKVLLGVILGIGFGFLGTIPWILVGYLGFFVSILGFIIGIAAYKGFVLGAGKMHIAGIATILFVIMIAIPLSEITLLFIEGLKLELTFMEALTATPEVFVMYIGDFIPNILLGYLFAFLGAWRVIKP